MNGVYRGSGVYSIAGVRERSAMRNGNNKLRMIADNLGFR